MYALQEQAAPDAAGHDGKVLVIRRAHPGAKEGIPLQPLCVKCGLPASGTLARRFFWYPRWVYFFILVNVLVFAIVAVIARKRLDVQVPLCTRHRERRRKLILVAWLVALAGVALPIAFAALELQMVTSIFPAFLLLFGGGVMGAIVSNPIKPIRIDEGGGRFTGCSPAFFQNSVF
jgi:hypothetical protein